MAIVAKLSPIFMPTSLTHRLFRPHPPAQFEGLALQLFRHQAQYNTVYQQYIQLLHIDTDTIHSIYDIPFLPVELFKKHRIVTGNPPIQQTFTSSGTTGSINSRHDVADVSLYEQSFMHCFELFYGNIQQYAVLALLPAYLERSGSSLVYMANYLIRESRHPQSNFYLYNHAQLAATLSALNAQQQPTILLGVTFALLDFAEQYAMPLPHTIIIETGGMKGRRREMVRPEIHTILQNAFGTKAIHSEYGMTELLSQAYSKGDGIFKCPPWMHIVLRDINTPTDIIRPNTASITGAINVIDLANEHSCAFIATADIARQFADDTFEVLGRIDDSDLRGCNLMV